MGINFMPVVCSGLPLLVCWWWTVVWMMYCAGPCHRVAESTFLVCPLLHSGGQEHTHRHIACHAPRENQSQTSKFQPPPIRTGCRVSLAPLAKLGCTKHYKKACLCRIQSPLDFGLLSCIFQCRKFHVDFTIIYHLGSFDK